MPEVKNHLWIIVAPSVDEQVVAQLTEMGFHANAARRAVVESGNSGSEAATNWIMQHMDDANLNDPLDVPNGSDTAFIPNEEAVQSIEGMGFTSVQAKKALKATDNNVERAVDWIFSHMDELNDPDPVQPADVVQPQAPNCTDGAGSKLFIFTGNNLYFRVAQIAQRQNSCHIALPQVNP